MNARVDAAIVGGGPAGAIVARRLARSGLKVMLLERGGELRDKACGCCLAPRALPMLEREGLLDVAKTNAVGETRIIGIHGARDLQLRSPLVPTNASGGLLVPRAQFDQSLRNAAVVAGANVLESASARVETIDRDGATLAVAHDSSRFTLRCRLLIGADGLGSAVARAAGLATRFCSGRKFGFSMTMADAGETRAIEPNAIEMFLVDGGYVGVVRLTEGRLHCAAIFARTPGSPAVSPIEIIQAAATAHSAIARLSPPSDSDALRCNVLACGPMPWRPIAVAASSVALVGDAAGYVEPFTGEGMAWAIESAILLADGIDSSGGKWCEDAAREYAAAWRERIGGRQGFSRMVAGALELRALHSLMLRAANAAPFVARRAIARAVAA